MSLAPGTRFGAYEVVALIGAGGMGEVYRARDTRLKREVAIKVLPDAFAHDAERLARFQREAELLATLSHPNIGAVFGLEQADGTTGIVLELIDGETLADRLQRGPMPVEDTLTIARQIADALEAAHDRGLVHRDLKPANIKLKVHGDPTPAGAAGARLERRPSAADVADCTVKVLDFGLAKAIARAEAGPYDKGLSQAPTLTTPALMTGGGVILGTAAYMSPEQARGKDVDKRTDIWAFGCVLYEMLTGTRVFASDEVSHTLAAVLRADPDWTRLPATTPPPIKRLLRRCLDKDRKHRLADISDARLELEEALDRTPPEVVASGRKDNIRGRTLITAAFGLVLGSLIAGSVVWFALRSSPPPARTLRRFTLSDPQTLAGGLRFEPSSHNIAISPDGSRVAYVGANGFLFVRSLDRIDPVSFPELARPAR